MGTHAAIQFANNLRFIPHLTQLNLSININLIF